MNNTAHLDFVKDFPEIGLTIGEDTDLKSEFTIIDLANRFIDISKRIKRCDRSEDFLIVDFHTFFDSFEKCRSQKCPVSFISDETVRSPSKPFVDPFLETVTVFLVNDTPDIGVFLSWITYFYASNSLEKSCLEFIEDILVNINPLDRDTRLTRLIVGSHKRPTDHPVPVRHIFVDDKGCISTKLKNDFFLPCLIFHVPSHMW